MIAIEYPQGSDQWLAARAKYFTASEAPAMMGASKKVTRNELLRIKATGTDREISDWVQTHLFDKGHAIEAAARPIAERIIGEELFPVTATDDDGYLLASFDGITMLEDACWECKSWNEAKAAEVREGRCPEEDYWQVAQQLVVSGAERCLYMLSDGTEDQTIHCWVTLADGDREKLLAGWAQFAQDRDAYVVPEAVSEPVGAAPESLPALRIEITGQVTNSNLESFRRTAMAVFSGINRDLKTDQHFADAERTVKWCSEVESRLAAAKEHALSQTASIDELFRTIDDISAEARRVRLDLDRLVKARKEQVRAEIVAEGKTALDAHVAALNKRLGDDYIAYRADFAAAIKSKRTIDSLRNAVDTTLAHAKIETSAMADAVDANLKAAAELADDMSLLPDLRTLALKPAEDFRNTVKLRIAEREAREKAELERIRAEERAKAEREAREAEEKRQSALRASEEAERQKQREAEAARAAEQRRVESERRAAEEARLKAEREALAEQQAKLERQRQEAAAERAEAERRERERRSEEERRAAAVSFAAPDLLAAAEAALHALENPKDAAAGKAAVKALRAAIALAKAELEPAE
mgnify:CR=1 FL=1